VRKTASNRGGQLLRLRFARLRRENRGLADSCRIGLAGDLLGALRLRSVYVLNAAFCSLRCHPLDLHVVETTFNGGFESCTAHH